MVVCLLHVIKYCYGKFIVYYQNDKKDEENDSGNLGKNMNSFRRKMKMKIKLI